MILPIRYQERFIYLATVMEMFTREIVGWNVSRYHNKALVIGALRRHEANGRKAPQYIHSDQGSEDAEDYMMTPAYGITFP